MGPTGFDGGMNQYGCVQGMVSSLSKVTKSIKANDDVEQFIPQLAAA